MNHSLLSRRACQDCTVSTRLCSRPHPLPTPGLLDTHSKSGSASCGVAAPSSWAPRVHKGLEGLCHSRCQLPQSWGSSVIKSHRPSESNPWESSVPWRDPQGGKSVMGPRIFTTVQEHLWCDCSPVRGSSARWLWWANGDLLQEDPCHQPASQVCCSQSPVPAAATADPAPTGDTQRQVWLRLL